MASPKPNEMINIGIDMGRVEAVGETPTTLNYTMAKVILLEEKQKVLLVIHNCNYL